ncbi:MAG: hypothetical protein AB7L84_15525 [Acidimicrobiia bacterium]
MAGKRHLDRIHGALAALEGAASPLDAADAARRLRISAEALERDQVKAARKRGYSWDDIGRLYKLTKQGAQQRFRTSQRSRPTKGDADAASRARTRTEPDA